jgi:formylglycine-generating enzyme required for sulfatase activity
MLFCHWLGARLGHDECALRLPTELEWQCAAIGTDPREGDPKRVYPWGGDWDPRRETWLANTVESELNRSTAVGLYPLGMAGTIYEWCLNAFENPDDIGMPKSNNDRRVLRGGSWDDDRGNARSAYRVRYYPDGRGDGVGFRVLCSSPIFDH